MEIKDIIKGKIEKNDISSVYVPSSSEKKRAIMMYLFFGIVVGISKKTRSPYEVYHLRQASGWWILFILVIILELILLFGSITKYLGIIPVIVLIVVRLISIRNAWNGKYLSDKKDSILSIFSGVGGWALELFDLGITVSPSDITHGKSLDKDKENIEIMLDGLQTDETSLDDDIASMVSDKNSI